MRRASGPFRVGDTSSVGWISTADVFVYASVLFLIVALVLDARLAKGDPKVLLTKIERQDALIAELQVKNAQLKTTTESLNTGIAALRSENGRLKESERDLQMHLTAMEIERVALEAVLKIAKSERDVMREMNSSLRVQLATLQSTHDDMAEELAMLVLKYKGKEKEVEDAKKKHLELLEFLANEGRLRRELIGLQGRMKAVSIVIDCSGSMLENNRWDSARKVLDDWLLNLDMESCQIIVFSTTVRVFPADGSFLSLRGTDGVANRGAIKRHLEGIQPEGGTNTLAALEKAYEAPQLDAIVLFTDGAPNDGKSFGIDKKIANRIYELCAAEWRKREIPINAVGLGDYFHKDLSEFLLEVSKVTHGTFIGR